MDNKLINNHSPLIIKKVPELRFSEFEGNRIEKKLGELGNFSGGGTPESTNADYWSGTTPWISSSDIGENNIQEIEITLLMMI